MLLSRKCFLAWNTTSVSVKLCSLFLPIYLFQIYTDKWLRDIHITLRVTQPRMLKISIMPEKYRTSCLALCGPQWLPTHPQKGSHMCSQASWLEELLVSRAALPMLPIVEKGLLVPTSQVTVINWCDCVLLQIKQLHPLCCFENFKYLC